ncbi:hypothetical protein DPX39_040014000 [Trypanosoma brucei equiperdum]|uniref:Uncharacterized protein n=1 Tax=Trypanosoma brucei equiperdum TaxID=630700 RepID=A0A3L6L8Q6_9TRYP|nr:hypothetical protein DPX39_040014000 [Trypanosoma brucei equiperdum]
MRHLRTAKILLLTVVSCVAGWCSTCIAHANTGKVGEARTLKAVRRSNRAPRFPVEGDGGLHRTDTQLKTGAQGRQEADENNVGRGSQVMRAKNHNEEERDAAHTTNGSARVKPPDDKETEAQQPDDNESEPQQPDDNETEAQQPDDNESEPQQPDDNESEPQQPDDKETEAQQPDDNESEPQQPDDNETEAQQPDDKETETQQPDDKETEAQQPDDKETEAQQPDDKETEAQQPDDNESEPQQPDDKETEAQQPDDNETEAQQPDDNESEPQQPDDNESEPQQPDDKETEAQQPDDNETEAQQPDDNESEPQQPDDKETEAQQPDDNETEAQQPDDNETEAQQPDDKETEAQQPDDKETEAQQPDDKETEAQQPDDKETEAQQPDDNEAEPQQPDDNETEAQQPDDKETELQKRYERDGKDSLEETREDGTDFVVLLKQLADDASALASLIGDDVYNMRGRCVVQNQLVPECREGVMKLRQVVAKIVDTVGLTDEAVQGGRDKSDFSVGGCRCTASDNTTVGDSHGNTPAPGQSQTLDANPFAGGDVGTYGGETSSINMSTLFFTVISIVAVSASGFLQQCWKQRRHFKTERVSANEVQFQCAGRVSTNLQHHGDQATEVHPIKDGPQSGPAELFPGAAAGVSAPLPPVVNLAPVPTSAVKQLSMGPSKTSLAHPKPPTAASAGYPAAPLNFTQHHQAGSPQPTRHVWGGDIPPVVEGKRDSSDDPDVLVNPFLKKWS